MRRNPFDLVLDDAGRRSERQSKSGEEREQAPSDSAVQKAGTFDEDGKPVMYGLTGITPLSKFWVG